MNIKLAALLICGAVLTLLAGFASYRYTAGLEAALRHSQNALAVYGNMIDVPVLKSETPRGARLMPEDFARFRLPEAQLPENILQRLPDPFPEDGLLAFGDLAANHLINLRDLGAVLPDGTAGYQLSQDGRAFAILPKNIDDFKEILRPEDKVDLIWTRSVGGGQYESRLLAAGVRILELPKLSGSVVPTSAESGPDLSLNLLSSNPANGDGGGEHKPSLAEKLVVQVSPKQAALLVQADLQGSFYILPSRADVDVSGKDYIVGPAQLLHLPMVVAAAGAVPNLDTRTSATLSQFGQGLGALSKERQMCQTAVIKGGTRAIIEVPC